LHLNIRFSRNIFFNTLLTSAFFHYQILFSVNGVSLQGFLTMLCQQAYKFINQQKNPKGPVCGFKLYAALWVLPMQQRSLLNGSTLSCMQHRQIAAYRLCTSALTHLCALALLF
jgi:hypothetical protein